MGLTQHESLNQMLIKHNPRHSQSTIHRERAIARTFETALANTLPLGYDVQMAPHTIETLQTNQLGSRTFEGAFMGVCTVVDKDKNPLTEIAVRGIVYELDTNNRNGVGCGQIGRLGFDMQPVVDDPEFAWPDANTVLPTIDVQQFETMVLSGDGTDNKWNRHNNNVIEHLVYLTEPEALKNRTKATMKALGSEIPVITALRSEDHQIGEDDMLPLDFDDVFYQVEERKQDLAPALLREKEQLWQRFTDVEFVEAQQNQKEFNDLKEMLNYLNARIEDQGITKETVDQNQIATDRLNDMRRVPEKLEKQFGVDQIIDDGPDF